MKKIQVISFLPRDQIILRDANPLFHVSSGDNQDEIEKYYFQVEEDYLVEILIIPYPNLKQIALVSGSLSKQPIILIKEFSDELDQNLEQLLKHHQALILTGSHPVNLKTNSSILQFIPLKNKQAFDFSLLIDLFNHQEIRKELQFVKPNSVAIIGKHDKEQVVSQIVVEILTELSLIPTSARLELYLFTSEALGLQDLANLEDPLSDYLQYESFQIKQYVNDHLVNQVKYLFLVSPSSNQIQQNLSQ